MNELSHITEEPAAMPKTTTYIREEAFPELVKPAVPPVPGKRHNLALVNKLLSWYGLEIDAEMETIKIKSLWRYLAGAFARKPKTTKTGVVRRDVSDLIRMSGNTPMINLVEKGGK